MRQNESHFRARFLLDVSQGHVGRIASVIIIMGFAAMFLVSCKREARSFDVPPAAAEQSANVPWLGSVRPGPTTGPTATTTQPVDMYRLARENFANDYTNNAASLSDGQRLYGQFNCVGCHAHGGGGMGPPLMDAKWFYGGDPQNVYLSILQGRPHGMPSFRGRIPDFEIWELTAYVRSLSGQSDPNAAAGRDENMTAGPPPNSISKATTQNVSEPTTGPATNEVGGQSSARLEHVHQCSQLCGALAAPPSHPPSWYS